MNHPTHFYLENTIIGCTFASYVENPKIGKMKTFIKVIFVFIVHFLIVNFSTVSKCCTAGSMAKGILETHYGHHYCDCLNTTGTSGFKSGSVNMGYFNQAFGIKITVEPNPAKEWAAFNYSLPDKETQGVIKITDVTGKIIETFVVSGVQGQRIWDTRKIKQGIYFYTFTVNGMSNSGKIVISN